MDLLEGRQVKGLSCLTVVIPGVLITVAVVSILVIILRERYAKGAYKGITKHLRAKPELFHGASNGFQRLLFSKLIVVTSHRYYTALA